jgi:hypothetical protein
VADITRGDRNPRSANLQTFNPMFPTGAYLNIANPIGPANFIQVHPSIDFRYNKVTLEADWAFVWRESVEDGIYGPIAGLLRPVTLAQPPVVEPSQCWPLRSPRHARASRSPQRAEAGHSCVNSRQRVKGQLPQHSERFSASTFRTAEGYCS